MNLRLENQTVRFRISKEELETLCTGKTLQQTTCFPHVRLNIQISTYNEQAPLRLVTEPQSWQLHINKAIAQELLNSLPNREGVQHVQAVDGSTSLHLMLEVDIRTQKRKRGEHGT